MSAGLLRAFFDRKKKTNCLQNYEGESASPTPECPFAEKQCSYSRFGVIIRHRIRIITIVYKHAAMLYHRIGRNNLF